MLIDRYQLCQCQSDLNHEEDLFVIFNILAPFFPPKPCGYMYSVGSSATACSYTAAVLQVAALCWRQNFCLVYKCIVHLIHAIVTSAIFLHNSLRHWIDWGKADFPNECDSLPSRLLKTSCC